MASPDSDRAINDVPAERLAEQIQHCKGEVGVLSWKSWNDRYREHCGRCDEASGGIEADIPQRAVKVAKGTIRTLLASLCNIGNRLRGGMTV
jgi:hypothetical protein